MSEIPETAPKPTDHAKKKSADARKAEVEGFADIEFGGITFRIPLGKKIPIFAVRAFRDGDEFKGTELLLGDDQFEALEGLKPTAEEYEEFVKKLTEVLGN